jgi:CHAD domain-containing protein
VLSNAKNVIADDVRDRAREDFGWFGEVTGPARDLDVYQIEWSTYTGPLAADAAGALEPVRVHLEAQRQDAHMVLSEELAAERAEQVIDDWNAWLDGPVYDDDCAADSERPIGALIAKRIRRAHRTMIDRGRTITPDTDAGVLHELRKDAKKLRYLLECFGGLYDPAARKAFVQRLKALQDNLGEHQDAEVHVLHLRELSDTLAPKSTTETVLATGQLIERMEQRRIACRHEFAERFAAFDCTKTTDALAALLASTSDGPAA